MPKLVLCLALTHILLSLPAHADTRLLIFDFNRDCAADTLCGDIAKDTIRPTHIRWGDHAPCPPPGDPYHDSLRHAWTWLKLPPLLCLNALPSSANMNSAQDTTDDLTLFMRGKVSDGQGGFTDSALVLILFGRHGLDTLDTLNLCAVTTSTLTTPFAAMRLSSSNLVNPAELWPGGQAARLGAITMPVAKQGRKSALTLPPGSIRAQLRPAPSRDYALLTAEGLPEGDVPVVIVDARGRSIQRFSLRGSPFAEQRLDLSGFAAGQYTVVLMPENLPVVHVPLIILR